MKSTGKLLLNDLIKEYLADPTEEGYKELHQWFIILQSEYK